MSYSFTIIILGLEAWRAALAAHAEAEGRQPTIDTSAENTIFQSLADVPGYITTSSYTFSALE